MIRAIVSGRWCRLRTRFVTPCPASHLAIRRTIGSPATGTAAFARTSVSGRSRVPRPAVSISAWRNVSALSRPSQLLQLLEQHVRDRDAARFAVDLVQPAIRVDEVVAGSAAERLRRVGDSSVAAFDLDERPDRRFVQRQQHIVERELFAILLIAEPDAEAELLEDAHDERAVADDGLELFAQFRDRRLDRTFVGEQTPPGLDADPEHASPPPQIVVRCIEQAVFLKTPAAHRRGAGIDDGGAGALGIVESQLDLALE